jgi:hypothetical protein
VERWTIVLANLLFAGNATFRGAVLRVVLGVLQMIVQSGVWLLINLFHQPISNSELTASFTAFG